MVSKYILPDCSSGHVKQPYSHKYFVKIKLSSSKGWWSSKISEIEQNDVTNDVIGQILNMISKYILPDCSFGHVKQPYPSWVFRKNHVQ